MIRDTPDPLDAMSMLLETVIDSYERLDVLLLLYRASPHAQNARRIGRTLQLSAETVTNALVALYRAGIVRMHAQDDIGWSFARDTRWTRAIEFLRELHDIDRGELLAYMRHVGVQSVRPFRTRTLFVFGRARPRVVSAPS